MVRFFLAMMLIGFIGTGATQIAGGNYKQGIASVLLAIVNGALLS
jgi:hypothetical protein